MLNSPPPLVELRLLHSRVSGWEDRLTRVLSSAAEACSSGRIEITCPAPAASLSSSLVSPTIPHTTVVSP